MKFGISIIVRGDDANPDTFAQMGETADAQASDCLWASDHLIVPAMKTSDTLVVQMARFTQELRPHFQ